MKNYVQNLTVSFTSCLCLVVAIAVSLIPSNLIAQGEFFSIAQAPGPTIPTLNPDDSYITYTYQLSGTGCWEGDPSDYTASCIMTVNESWAHFNSNNVETSGAGSMSDYIEFDNSVFFNYPDPTVYTYTYTNDYCPQNCPGTELCGGQQGTMEWYTCDFGIGDSCGVDCNNPPTPTTTTLSCGTLQTGTSVFSYTHQFEDEPPNQITHILGAGTLYQLNLTITRDCSASSTPTNLPPLPCIAQYQTSANPMTPTGGVFSSNGKNFTFSFGGTSGSSYSIYASPSLYGWTLLGTATVPSGATNVSFTHTNATNFEGEFYLVVDGSGNISSPYGFINLSLPAGYKIISDPLYNDPPAITNVLAKVPNGSTLSFWSGSDWVLTSSFSDGAWDNNALFMPGEGALIYVPSTTNITFIGEVLQGCLTNALPEGISAVSSQVPQSESLQLLGLTQLKNGDTLTRLQGTNYVSYTNENGTWSPSMPSLGICEAVLINAATNENWARNCAFPSIYVTDTNNDCVDLFDVSGNFVTSLSPGGMPWDIEYAPLDNCFYVTIFEHGTVSILDTSGNILSSEIGGDPLATGITSTERGSEVYVSCILDGDVEEFDTDGDFVGSFGSFNTPMGIADDGDRNFWIADASGALYEYDSNGDYVTSVTSHLSSPWGLIIDKNANLWITDAGNKCVLEFSGSGEYITSFGNGNLSSPRFLTIDDMGNFWVVDAGNKCVSKFNSSGTYTSSFGSEILSGPQGIAFH